MGAGVRSLGNKRNELLAVANVRDVQLSLTKVRSDLLPVASASEYQLSFPMLPGGASGRTEENRLDKRWLRHRAPLPRRLPHRKWGATV